MSSGTELIAAQYAAAARNKDVWGKIVVNVRDFASSSDPDDTNAIQKAIDYAKAIGKKEVTFPPGTYVYTDLTNMNGLTFIGDGVTLTGNTPITLTSVAKVSSLLSKSVVKTSSVPINASGETAYSNLPFFDKVMKRLKVQGLDVCLVPFSDIATLTSATFTHYTASQIQGVIDVAKENGVSISIMKPHIGIGFADTINRADYNPSDVTAFFENWGNELIFYAGLCIENDIEWLCISCEQFKVTTQNHYFTQWQALVSKLHTQFPSLKLTIACTRTEIAQTMSDIDSGAADGTVLTLVDAIGLNNYQAFFWNLYAEPGGVPSITIDDVQRGLWRDMQGLNTMNLLENCYNHFKLPIIITEFGCMSKVDGLVRLMATGTTNHNVQALLFQAYFEQVLPLPYVIGFSIWNIYAPFNYFDFDGLTVYPSEQVIINYSRKGYFA